MLFRSGAVVTVPVKTREDFTLFSESQSRVIVSVNPADKEKFEKILSEGFTPFTFIGKTGGAELSINSKYKFDLNVISDLYYNSIQRLMHA